MISTYIHYLSHIKTKIHYRTIIISDVHLGTPDSKHKELLDFLKKNSCDHLIINGDFIDGWYLHYFPTRPLEQRDIIEYILNLGKENKTKITYLKGNHERFRRNILPIQINNIHFTKKLIYTSGDKKYVIIHGQQFDKNYFFTGNISFLGGIFLFRLNRKYNERRKKQGKPYYSIVEKIKRIMKKIALGGEDSFEKKVKKHIKEENCDGLICGHLHKPEIKQIGIYNYMNSGDRVESCTALVETNNNEWKLIKV